MGKRYYFLLIIIFPILGILLYKDFTSTFSDAPEPQHLSVRDSTEDLDRGELVVEKELHPLQIDYLRNIEFTGSDITIEQTLNPGSNYSQYITSYKSEGLKIYALLTIPNTPKPESGWPVVIFNHGYIPPAEYRTTQRYESYINAFATRGYIVFKPDYRGHGNSEGQAGGGYSNPNYTIDVLNALSSIKKHPDVNVEKLGMWGHSMGGSITLRAMVVTKDIKAGVIWAGVVGSYEDIVYNWHRRPQPASVQPETTPNPRRRWRDELVEQYGTPQDNVEFWNSISPTSYLYDISGPIQLHHGTADTSVPVEFSEKLDLLLKEQGQDTELYIYPNDNHNISLNFNIAMNRSVEFFDRYLK